ncbi:MAG: NadS family protein [Armatimonadota bacterium]|nr:helix-turn-helix domain-containing protein [bacterium]MCS7310558.1 helix-turn-helix domain-containing protein [Armatimonadota bacterium]MDW8105632.1 NadS family protein [Armatimonadota bacterium]
MNQDLFEELVHSVREGGAILRGEKAPARAFEWQPLDIKAIRQHFGLSQSRFAAMIGISPSTLRNWEQGRRRPRGAARILLEIAARNPQAVREVVEATLGRNG